jgi:DGQHR domain-containing protein
MRLALPAVEVKQHNQTQLYLTKLSVGQIKGLIENKQLVIDTYNPDIKIARGYQRTLDENRIRKMLTFLESKYKIVLHIMPTSVVLSSRKSATEPIKFKDGKLIIGDDATLFVVDGQHRIWGIKNHKDENYEVPTTIVYGLSEHQEAAQFLVINSTQKKVDPSLQLRVLFYAEEKLMMNLINEIKNVIPWQSWKLEALKIAIDLENDPENPWYKRVKQPNDASNDWKPIREGSFVDSFRQVCIESGPIAKIQTDIKEKYVKSYWNVIKSLWPKPFENDFLSDYILVGPFGAGVFNTLFPSVLAINLTIGSSFEEMLKPIAKRYPLRTWTRRKGELAKFGGGHGAYTTAAEDFLKVIDKNFDYINFPEYVKIRERAPHNMKSLVDKAYDVLSPLQLRTSDNLKQEAGKHKRACYVLVNLKDDMGIEVYVGQSKTAEKRLGSHNKKFNLYNMMSCKNEQEMNNLEGVLWHLVKPSVRSNDNHPNKDSCWFCK